MLALRRSHSTVFFRPFQADTDRLDVHAAQRHGNLLYSRSKARRDAKEQERTAYIVRFEKHERAMDTQRRVPEQSNESASN